MTCGSPRFARGRFAVGRAPGPPQPRRGFRQFPELGFTDYRHTVSPRRETSDLHQLHAPTDSGNLKRVRPTAHQNVRRRSWLGLHDRAGLFRCGYRFAPRAAQEAGKGEALAVEASDAAEIGLLRSVTQGSNQLARGLIPLAPRPEASVDHFLELVAAWETTDIATPHRTLNVTAQQHRRDQTDLVNVVALLPAPNPAPCDLGRRGKNIESVRGDATLAKLVGRDAEVAQLQLLILTNENVERREVAMHCLPQVQHVESSEDCGDLASDEAFRLRALAREPGPEISVHRVLHSDAIARTAIIDLGEPVEDAQCARLAEEELGEIGLADPRRKTFGDLDADLCREPVLRCGCREVDFAESSLTNQLVQLIGSAAL